MEPHYQEGPVTLYRGDCREVMASLSDNSVDAIVTDPPYELGFMGKGWDSSGIAYDSTVWSEAFRVLKPGGHALVFGGTRTWHRVAVAVENAGFEIRDSFAWLHGQGFPKSMDVAAAIDKLDATAERLIRARQFQAWLSQHMTARRVNELTGTDMGHHLTTHPTQPAIATSEIFDMLRPELPSVPSEIESLVSERTVESKNLAARATVGIHRSGISRGAAGVTASGAGKAQTVAHTEEAREWDGWGTAVKPAFEPVVMARKPLAGTVAATVLEHGTGALNVAASRIAMSDVDRAEAAVPMRAASPAKVGSEVGRSAEYFTPAPGGRFPSNVLLDESQAAELDKQSGVLTSGSWDGKRNTSKTDAVFGSFESRDEPPRQGDSGGASRFFYVAKAGKNERPVVDGHQHATVKPLALMRYLVRMVTPPGGTVLEPFAGSGTTIEAAVIEGFNVIAAELDEDGTHIPLIMKRLVKPHQQTLFGDVA